MDEEERQQDSDLRQSRTTAKISATETLEQQEKIRIPPSVSRPVKRKRVDVGGKMYEDELMVLNVRLKRYGYESAITLLRDFKDGVFPEDYFKPQGAISMGENQSNSGAVSLIDGKPNPDFLAAPGSGPIGSTGTAEDLFGEDFGSTVGNYPNIYLWQAVDQFKAQGYTLTSVMLGGQGSQGNPHQFFVVMSK